jgi:membrane-bound metal-dependent hydrolase YbcI (DUF457 family)
MPVLGHAFVGFATAVAVPPRRSGSPQEVRAAGVWAPALVAIAYLPDLVAQTVRLAGGGDVRQATHSLLAALLLSPPLAAGLAWACGARYGRAFAVVLGSVLLHDALDILEWPGRQPWWPFSDWSPAIEPVLPSGVWAEVLIYGAIAALVVVGRGLLRDPEADGRRGGFAPLGSFPLPARWALSLLAVAAAFTHFERGVREHQASAAKRALARGDAVLALDLIDQASRWPAVARPGRLDLLRAEALSDLGRLDEAEPLFLRARQADPTNFWAWADLATFYAELPRPPEERHRLADPLAVELRSRFPYHPRLPEVLAQVERRLSR